MTPEQEQKLNEIYEFMLAMKNSQTIPLEVDRSFRERFSNIVAGLSVSTKAANSEDVSVNEGGSASYTVLDDPDGFLQVVINGTTYHLPYYT